MTVDFITFCHPGDMHRLYHANWLAKMIASHEYPFETIRIIHQRCGNKMPLRNWDESLLIDYTIQTHKSENHPNILTKFGLPEKDPVADKYTHGPTAAHYWKWHVINHLIGLKVSTAKYIVFSDNDCTIKSHDPGYNWIRRGIEILTKYPQVLIVSPGDGGLMMEAQIEGGYRCTQNVSQQLFLCDRKRLLNVDFDIPWDWEVLAPGGPMQEYYYMLEGRIWRYLHKYGLWRCVLPDYIARYWHWNRLDEGYFIDDASLY